MARSRSKGNEVFDMLKEDHDKVKQSLKEFEKLDRGDAEACRQLIEATCEDLKVHTTLEEELFYPALREAMEEEELLNEAAVEHETAKMLIEQIENMSADDPNYHATFTVLGEYVQHHIKEEEGELFPAAAKCGLDFGSLAERMRSRKEELVGETAREQA
jgi:hemerythrin-like domain-containing protein